MYLCFVYLFLLILINVNLENVIFVYRRKIKFDKGFWYNWKENGVWSWKIRV